MNTQDDNQISDKSATLESTISVGKTLRAAREQLGLSVNDVANRIKFAPRQIEALEDDDYVRLPEAAFVRGFVRSYARLLELDPARLLAGLPSSHTQSSAAQEVKSVEIAMPTASTARRYNIALLAAGLVIALSVAIFERLNDDAPEKMEPVAEKVTPLATIAVQPLELPNVTPDNAPAQLPEKTITSVPAQQQAIPQKGVRAAQTPAAQQPAAQQVVRVPQVAVQSQQTARPAPMPAPSSASAVTPAVQSVSNVPPAAGAETIGGAEHALRLEFDEEAWVEIKDASEQILVSRMHRAGSLVRVTGKAPLVLVIGNARAVRLFDNGKKINLERYTAAEVARVTLK
jgi:cytoskeleton protein RodZ